MLKLLKQRWWICQTLLGLYVALCLLLWWGQSRLMFFPSPTLKATPATLMPYQEVWLPMPIGKVNGWWIPAAADAPVILYFHGNGSNLGDLVNKAERWHRLGVALLLIDYRGYGHSSGQFPSEASVYEDAEAAWRYLTQQRQIPPQKIVLYGQSIGGAVAIDLAVKHPDAAAVIVESSFTSMRAMIARSPLRYLFPLDRLLTQRFDSLSKVGWLRMPMLLIHGTADTTIPVSMSQELDAAAADAELLLVAGADHNTVAKRGGAPYLQTIADFVEQACRCQLQENQLQENQLQENQLQTNPLGNRLSKQRSGWRRVAVLHTGL